MKNLAFALVGIGGLLWAYNWYQQSVALNAGTITADQTLTWADRIYSPAGVMVIGGLGLLVYDKVA